MSERRRGRINQCGGRQRGSECSVKNALCSRISNFIWNKDYQGLFDYDSKSIEKKMIKVIGNAVVLKNHKKFELEDDIPYQSE